MDNLAFSQRLKGLLLCSAGLLFAIFLGLRTGNADYRLLLLISAVVVIASVGLFLGESFWVLTIASSFLSGTFPILGGQFTPFQILMVMGIARFVIGDVILRRRRIHRGNRFDLLMLAGFMGILFFHGVHDRFGMRYLGSNVWGGRNYVNVFVGLAAFFIVRSIPLKPAVWAKLPYAILAVTGFDAFISLITTLFPSSIYKIYPFYSAVSLAGLQEILVAPMDPLGETTARLGTFGIFGFIVILLVLASTSLSRLLRRGNFLRFISAMAGSLGILFAGYRTSVLQALLATLITGIRDLKWATLALIPIVAGGLFALSIVNSEFVALPKAVQRSLQFMPGKWDPEMQLNAESSNRFRKQVWSVFVQEYFPMHPWFGRGFGFRHEMAQESIYKYNPNWDREAVEVGNVHNGFFATLDALGIVGTIFFIIWQLRLFARTFHVPGDCRDPASIALRFLALYLAVLIVFYWIGAYTVGTFLPQEFALAGVFLCLQQAIRTESATVSHRDAETQMQVTQPLSPV